MSPQRLCARCRRRLVDRAGEKCERCQRSTQVSVADVREKPWVEQWMRRLRSSAEWKRARTRRRRLDGYACTSCGRAGTRRWPLDAHHLDKLRWLAARAPDYPTFVRDATDVERLRTLCRRPGCHPEAERLATERASFETSEEVSHG